MRGVSGGGVRDASDAGAREVFEVLKRERGFAHGEDGMDLVMELPEEVSRGVVRTAVVREGVEVTVLDCVFAEDFSMEVPSGVSFLEVNLCLAGASRTRVEGFEGEHAVSALEDIERIHDARRIFAEKIKAPPSLVELSRMVGLNDFKLKAGFKRVYGITAFGYLHERRMEEARRLIEAGEMNVGEVALEVGYASPSRFAAVFKKHFGIWPGSLLPYRSGCRKASVNERQR